MPPPITSSSNHVLPKAVLDIIMNPLHGNSHQFVSVTRTGEEVSIVVDFKLEIEHREEEKVSEWSCIRIQGPMELNLVGILNHLTLPLKDAKIAVFAISTWNTDYLLVPFDKISQAIKVLRQDDWVVHGVDEP